MISWNVTGTRDRDGHRINVQKNTVTGGFPKHGRRLQLVNQKKGLDLLTNYFGALWPVRPKRGKKGGVYSIGEMYSISGMAVVEGGKTQIKSDEQNQRACEFCTRFRN